MKDAEDLQEYMLSLLDGSDPAVRAFLPRLMERWYAIGGKPPPNAKVSKLPPGGCLFYLLHLLSLFVCLFGFLCILKCVCHFISDSVSLSACVSTFYLSL